MADLQRLIPAKVKAENWSLGQCMAKVSEEYAELIMANRDLARAIDEKKMAERIKGRKLSETSPEAVAVHKASIRRDEEAVDLMLSIRTLLWKAGHSEQSFRDIVKAVNTKNLNRNYI